ncbi:MAG TPA: hypothetical protein VN812_14790 [Candidatus Acidoferrales bacterium]|jgi:hypothetical protein|nr:hypothetical protein [Candidatus Acidoferrales bacterium]
MKRTTGYIVAALGILILHRLAPVPAVQHAGSAAIRAAHVRTSIAPADDAGSDDDGDGDDSGADDSK